MATITEKMKAAARRNLQKARNSAAWRAAMKAGRRIKRAVGDLRSGKSIKETIAADGARQAVLKGSAGKAVRGAGGAKVGVRLKAKAQKRTVDAIMKKATRGPIKKSSDSARANYNKKKAEKVNEGIRKILQKGAAGRRAKSNAARRKGGSNAAHFGRR